MLARYFIDDEGSDIPGVKALISQGAARTAESRKILPVIQHLLR